MEKIDLKKKRLWKDRYGWRLFIIIPSFLIAGAILFSAVFIAPKLDKVKQLKHEQLKPEKVDTDLILYDAVADNDITRLKQVLAQGADPNFVDPESGMTPLFFADFDAAKILIKAGADIHARSNDNNTPLTWYTYSNNQKGIDYLLSLGADINAVNGDGNTALDIADHFGPPELIRFLKQRGALKNK